MLSIANIITEPSSSELTAKKVIVFLSTVLALIIEALPTGVMSNVSFWARLRDSMISAFSIISLVVTGLSCRVDLSSAFLPGVV